MRAQAPEALVRLSARFILSGTMVLAAQSVALAQSCEPGPSTVQILGSGGPATNPERASASYLLWIGGQAKILVDMGGGTYLRFAQSQAKLVAQDAHAGRLIVSHLLRGPALDATVAEVKKFYRVL